MVRFGLIVSVFVGIALGFAGANFVSADEIPTVPYGKPPKRLDTKRLTQWRGPLGTGEAPQADPPVEWSESKTFAGKSLCPARDNSTPVVWKDRIFLTTAIPFGDEFPPRFSGAPGAHDNVAVKQRHRFVAMAIDRKTGQTVWKKTLAETIPHEGAHYTASLASASPLVDDDHVFAYFGSHGLFCLTHNGVVVWEKNLGKMNTKHGHGEGSSPALFEDSLIVNWDHEGKSFITAFDKNTGEQQWRNARDEVTSWSSPIVNDFEGKPQVIVCGTNAIRSYQLSDGKEIWRCSGMSANIVATPIAVDGMVFAASSYEKQSMFAIHLKDATGDITDTDRVAWSRSRRTPYVPSPLVYRGSVYFLRHYQGILTRVDAKSGRETIPAARLGALRNIYASPIAAAGRIYITDLDGATMVIDHEKVSVLASNKLDDVFSASPVAVGNELILRGEKHLYCLANDKK